ncbi:MAG: right-handed parallel beta-helix repeat-containing protein, partial [Crocinitomicaceae bacterium]|nr:right-handed parallel beta-helix repeat-containing protein [Crocinitomicaceae bacterium]
QLLEYRKRREGPIVKFDESGVWQLHYVEKNEHKHYKVPALESAEVLPFKKNRTNKSQSLTRQFNLAKGQMERYRNHDPNVDDYFDIESLAKFIALSDVINGKHGTIWHNQRNYFNPVTNKLEPIAYDCFMAPDLISNIVDIEGLERSRKQNFTLIEAALSNKEVEEKYFEYLKKYSSKKYIDGLFKEFEKEIKSAEALLNFEYPNIKFNTYFFRNNAKQVREQLLEYAKHRKNPNVESTEKKPFEVLPENIIFTDMALKVNLEEKRADGSVTISVRNFHSADVEIFGYSTKANKNVIVPMAKTVLKALKSNAELQFIKLKEKPRRIHYRAKKCGSQEFKAKIDKWGIAKQPNFLSKTANVMVPKKGSKNIVLSGNNVFTSDVYVPKGYTLKINAGTVIKLLNNAAIVSHSPVLINGTKVSPVRISSPDGTGNGFTVISDQSSVMTYVTFDNLNTMNKNNWTLTGAVTFYGGDVTIDSCEFKNNNCEDGLNLIRCEFLMTNSSVENALSDGFDADFCEGELRSSTFFKTGNDCIDFSGSSINIENCTVIDAGDKGISGGEGSKLIIRNCTIDGSHIAIASKDLSEVNVIDVSITNSEYAFACYQKKPEYGPAIIKVEKLKKMEATHLKLLEKGSKLIYLNKTHVGQKKFDIDSMYMAYKK